MNRETIAEELALSLPNGIDVGSNGKRCTAKWPLDYSSHEQAIYRLVAERVAAILSREKNDR